MSRGTSRLVGFSDGVFAITITLLILEIKPPDGENLLHGLPALWPSWHVASSPTSSTRSRSTRPISGSRCA